MWQIHQDRQEAERKTSMSQGQDALEICSYCPVVSGYTQRLVPSACQNICHIWKQLNYISPYNLTVADPQVALVHG